MPTKLTTASAPVIALPTLASSRISAWTISGALGASAAILTRPECRTATRTVAPLCRSSATRWRPIKPVPPNTVMQPVITFLLPRALYPSCRQSRDSADRRMPLATRGRTIHLGQLLSFQRGSDDGGSEGGSESPLVAWGRPDERSFLHPEMRRPGSRAGIIGLERARFSQRRAGAIDPLQPWPCFALNV